MTQFLEYSYLWPPRPENAILPAMIPVYQEMGYMAQVKLNGTCSVVYVTPDKKIITKSRHNDDHKLWNPTPEVMRAFTSLPGNGWYAFVCELMHSKVKDMRNINYINDILVCDGTYLEGMTFEERQNLLATLFLKGNEEQTISHYVINEYTWLSRTYRKGFPVLFQRVVAGGPEYEGLVLKKASAPLARCFKPDSNSGWQVKTRRPHKNYSF